MNAEQSVANNTVAEAVDRGGLSIASGIGEPHTGADFGSAGGRGRKSVGGIGREIGSFGLWDPEERAKGCLLWSQGAPETENPTGRLPSEAIRCMSAVAREIKMEILV